MKKRFIFDENYIKKYAKKNKLKWIVIGGSVLLLILIIIIAISSKKPKKPSVKTPTYELKESLAIESGSEIPKIEDYFTKLENIDKENINITYPENFEISYNTSLCAEAEIEAINSGANADEYSCVMKYLKSPTTYGITITVLGKEHTVLLEVKDTTAPTLVLYPIEIYEGENYNIEDFVAMCTDESDICEPKYYENDVDETGLAINYGSYTASGTYKIKIYATDAYENMSEPLETTLTITKPESPLYTIKFNSDGGSAIENIKVEEGKTITEPNIPTKEGYTFNGWYLNNVKFDFNTPITKDLTLTAKWSKNNSGSGENDNVAVRSISLNYSKINLYIGEQKTVKATVNPSNATNKTVTWRSNDSSIATVENGKITGIKAGRTTITASAGGKSSSLEVVVVEQGSSTCTYGDASYNPNYILSVNLINNNCAVDPNKEYNEATAIVSKEYSKLLNDLANMGFTINSATFDYNVKYDRIKNNAGTGLVGYQITFNVSIIDLDRKMLASYIINPNGSRKIISSNIQKNGMSLN